MNSQSILIVIIIIIIIVVIVIICVSNVSNVNCNSFIQNSFKRIHPNKNYENKNKKNKQQKNKFSVNCYNDTACQNQQNGTGCRTIFYTDGICLNNNCIPTDDYDQYRESIINGDWDGVKQIEAYAKRYQNYENLFKPPACLNYIGL